MIDSPFKPGERVRLVRCADPHTRLQPGAVGTVTRCRAGYQGELTVGVSWDSGSSLSMLPDEGDVIEKVPGV